MADVLCRLVQSELIIQKHTVGPHIEAIKRILSGDRALLKLTFDMDEFDILSAGPMSFVQLPEDYKLLVGYDDIRIIQAFNVLQYLYSNDSNRLGLRSFVAENLKSKKKFLDLNVEQQHDVLNTYGDHLRALEHEGKRFAAFAFHVLSPTLRKYASSVKFRLFTTKPIFETLDRIASLQLEYKEFVPPQEFFRQSRDGGIQGAL
ncbi:MAG: hypothetical protein ACREPN_08550 [Rudaea sp.]